MPEDDDIFSARTCPTCSGENAVNVAIDNEDLVLSLQFIGAEALAQATSKQREIENRFAEANTDLVHQGDTISLEIEFSCGAEKILFLMAERSNRGAAARGTSA